MLHKYWTKASPVPEGLAVEKTHLWYDVDGPDETLTVLASLERQILD